MQNNNITKNLNFDDTFKCFTHIVEYWKPEYYYSCLIEWNEIKKNMHGDYVCNFCKKSWLNSKFIYQSVCPNCDDYIQPFLSNPKNYEFVLKYINKIYYKYIFCDFSLNKKSQKKRKYLIGVKENSEYGTSIILFSEYKKEKMRLFVNYYEDKSLSKRDYYISSFSRKGKGLNEEIYSNRTEYYLKGHYLGTSIDVKLEKIIYEINEKMYPSILKFIESSDEMVGLFYGEEFKEKFPFEIFTQM